jgi:hypothetical protein
MQSLVDRIKVEFAHIKLSTIEINVLDGKGGQDF